MLALRLIRWHDIGCEDLLEHLLLSARISVRMMAKTQEPPLLGYILKGGTTLDTEYGVMVDNISHYANLHMP